MNSFKVKFIKLKDGNREFYVTQYCISSFRFDHHIELKDKDNGNIILPEYYQWEFSFMEGGWGWSPTFDTKEKAAEWLEDNLGEFL